MLTRTLRQLSLEVANVDITDSLLLKLRMRVSAVSYVQGKRRKIDFGVKKKGNLVK